MKTFGDMMGEYQQVREGARCHSAWAPLDKFVEGLIQQIAGTNLVEHYKLSDFAPPIITPAEPKASFDGNGSPVEHD